MKNKKKFLYSILLTSTFLGLSFQCEAAPISPNLEVPGSGVTNPNITPNEKVPGSGFTGEFTNPSPSGTTPSALGSPTSPVTGSGGAYTNQEKIPGSEPTNDFVTYLKQIINFGFAIIGILALFMLIIGAYQYLMAAGSGKADSAKETISSALLGLVLGLTAWIILNKINPDLVNMNPISQISGGAAGTPGGSPAAQTSYNTANAGNVPAVKKERIAQYDQYVKAAAQKYGVPENAIRAVIDKESGWDPTAIGKQNPNDKGMMQINQPSHPNFFANNNWQDPAANINYGTSLLAEGYKATGSWEGAAGYFHRGPKNWNDTKGHAYSADFANKNQQYKNSGY